MTRQDSSFGRLSAAWSAATRFGSSLLGSSPATPLPAPAAPQPAPLDDAPSSWIQHASSQPHHSTAAAPWVLVASRWARLPSSFEPGLLASGHPERIYRIDPVAVSTLDELEQRCRHHSPRLIVIDFDLASAAGAEALHRFKRRVAASDLLMGTSPMQAEVDIALLREMRGLLEWTLTREQLSRALDAVIEGELWFPRAVVQALYLSLRSDVEATHPLPRHSALNSSGDGELTLRELEVMALMRQGFTNREIGDRLGISVNTVKKHLIHVFEKRGLRGRRQALEE